MSSGESADVASGGCRHRRTTRASAACTAATRTSTCASSDLAASASACGASAAAAAPAASARAASASADGAAAAAGAGGRRGGGGGARRDDLLLEPLLLLQQRDALRGGARRLADLVQIGGVPRALVDRRRARRAERAQRLPHVAAHDRLLNLLEELRDVRRRGVGEQRGDGRRRRRQLRRRRARLVHSGTGVDEPGLRAEMATLPTSGVSGRRFERDGGRGGVGGAVASWSGARWRRSPCGEPADRAAGEQRVLGHRHG